MKPPSVRGRSRLAGPLVVLACAVMALAATPQDLDKDLKSKDPAKREAALRQVAAQGGERAGKKLLAALDDDDWLVLLAAIDGLAAHGGRDALKPLLELARSGPFRLARERAAAALAACAPVEAAAALEADLRGKNGPLALPALAALAAAGARPESTARLERWLEDESAAIRIAAARAAVVSAAPDRRAPAVEALFAKGDLAMQAAALEVLAASAMPEDLAILGALLARRELAPVLERRAEAAAVAALGAAPDEAARAERLEATLLGAANGARVARIVAALGARVPPAKAVAWLAELAQAEDPSIRAAAAKALAAVGGEGALAAAVAGLSGGPGAGAGAGGDGRVRAAFARSAVALGAATTPEGEAALVAAAADPDGRVREAVLVGLGREGAGAAAVAALANASKDPDVELAVTAAVALGRTRADAALSELVALTKHSDWRLRGAAAMGLFHVAKPEVVAPLLALLSDSHSCVAATADRGLAVHAGREGERLTAKEWADWWQENAARVRFQTPDEARARRDKYGYSVPDREIYDGLDAVVVPGRGDLMESVLQRLQIAHRTVQAGQLGDQGLHPFAILVAGCTGELEQRDLEVVRWFVRAGGALFTSCWALTYTVDASFKGLVTKYPSPGEVLDRVRATPVALGSPYLTGVFDGGVVPIYELQGAHLIQVLDSRARRGAHRQP